MRDLPDPHLSLHDASDYIFGSQLVRIALADPHPRNLAVLIRDVIVLIHRLTVSCQLAEFTEHGLPHLCSLIDRIDRWTIPSTGASPSSIVSGMTAGEAGQLVLAVLFHDIGMLSQRPDDMPGAAPVWESRGTRDLATWVRETHVRRMKQLLRRSFTGSPLAPTLEDNAVVSAMTIAESHSSWPWEPPFSTLQPREAGLAAMLAISDLLDEDSNRCDIATLINHRWGTDMNRAHWIRHGLTQGRVLIVEDTINVKIVAPPGTGGQLTPVFAGLRNHFRLALLYREALNPFSGAGLNAEFNTPNGCPVAMAQDLVGWNRIPGFGSESALAYHLLSSFMPIGLLDPKRVDPATLARTACANLEQVDLALFHKIHGESEPRSADEHVFRALDVTS